MAEPGMADASQDTPEETGPSGEGAIEANQAGDDQTGDGGAGADGTEARETSESEATDEEKGNSPQDQRDELKIVIRLQDGRAHVGVTSPRTDPHLELMLDDDIGAVAAELPGIIQRALDVWQENPRGEAWKPPAKPKAAKSKDAKSKDAKPKAAKPKDAKDDGKPTGKPPGAKPGAEQPAAEQPSSAPTEKQDSPPQPEVQQAAMAGTDVRTGMAPLF